MQSFRPLWTLFSKLFRARLNARFPEKMVWPIFSGMALVTVLAGSTLIALAIWGFNQDEGALNYDLIWGEFVKGQFIIQTLMLLIWFIVSLKPNPARLEEFRFLLSLPIASQTIFGLFFLLDIIRLSWIPILFSVSLLGLLPVSSFAFVSRPILLGVISFFFFLAVMTCLQLFICFKSSRSSTNDYLTRFNPLLQGVVLVVFEGALLLSMLLPMSVSDLVYWGVLLILVLTSFLLMSVAKRLFARLYAANYWMQGLVPSERPIKTPVLFFTRMIQKRLLILNPLLFKNVIRNRHSRAKLSNLALAAGFVSAAYLMAMNNQNWEDSISVLLGLNIIYIVLFSSATINRFSPEFESTKIIFTLPISRWQFYYSAFVPALTWVVFVSSIMALLIVFTGSDVILAIIFWLESILAATLLLTIAINCALSNYPSLRISHKRFGSWLFGLIMACALFYKYRIGIAVVTTLLSFAPVWRVRLFRVPQQLTKYSFI